MVANMGFMRKSYTIYRAQKGEKRSAAQSLSKNGSRRPRRSAKVGPGPKPALRRRAAEKFFFMSKKPKVRIDIPAFWD
jgi:hypothetical protein